MCGRWRWGFGKLGTIAVVSGEQAQIAAGTLADIAEHWSRVDYCVTVLDCEGVLRPDEHYWEAWPPKDLPEIHWPKLRRWQEWHGGSTMQIGSRASARYMRIYDKHAESPREYPKGAWRWEIEMKREASEQQQRINLHLSQPGWHALNTITTEIHRLGLSVPWKPGAAVERSRQIKYIADADRTLGWLAQQVAPSAQFAAQARGRDAVLAALNI